MRKIKSIALIVAFVLALALLAGCGARVTTKMTVDANFSGTREIKLTIDNEDLTKVTGGIEALKGVIDSNLPADMTYTITDNATADAETTDPETTDPVVTEATETYITFVITFSDLEDYRAKVGRLIALDPETEIQPQITYEKQGSIFKQGVKFQENFTSFDLIKWYFNALVTADIITEADTSDWYELGSDEVTLDGATYTAYNHYFEVEEQEISCLDNGEVVTTLLPDGTIERVITLVADENTVSELDEKAGGSLENYMKALATDGIRFETAETDYGDVEYIYTFTASKADEIVAKTNKVLQTENNTFTLELAAKENAFGVATVKISESLDGSFYFNYSSSLQSRYVLYPNAVRVEGDAYYGSEENEFYYYPNNGEARNFVCEWLVNYQSVDLEVHSKNDEKLEMSLVFTLSETFPEDVRQVAQSALESAAKNNGEFEKDGASVTVTFAGTAAEVMGKVNAFVRAYVPVDEDVTDDETLTYCSIELKELGTSSKFTNGVYGDMWINLEPIIGEQSVTVRGRDGLAKTEIVSSHSKDDEGNLFEDSDVDVRFATVQLNFVMIGLTVLAGVLLLVGLLIGIRHRQDFKLLAIKKAAPVAPAVSTDNGAVAPTDGGETVPVAVAPEVPVTVPAEEPVAESAPVVEDEEEEEIL